MSIDLGSERKPLLQDQGVPGGNQPVNLSAAWPILCLLPGSTQRSRQLQELVTFAKGENVWCVKNHFIHTGLSERVLRPRHEL